MTLRTTRKAVEPPLPTDAELDILAILWRHGPSTVRQIHEALEKDSGYTTTLKQMQLMTDKGMLVRLQQPKNQKVANFRGIQVGVIFHLGSAHLYDVAIPKEETQKQIAGDVLRRAFESSTVSLMAGALAAQPPAPGEVRELRHTLDEFEKARKS